MSRASIKGPVIVPPPIPKHPLPKPAAVHSSGYNTTFSRDHMMSPVCSERMNEHGVKGNARRDCLKRVVQKSFLRVCAARARAQVHVQTVTKT